MKEIERLLGEVREVKVSALYEPAEEIRRGDQQLGILPEDLQALYALAQIKLHAAGLFAQTMLRDLGLDVNPRAQFSDDLLRELRKKRRKREDAYNIVETIFHHCLAERFDKIDLDNFAIRKGWHLVTPDPLESERAEIIEAARHSYHHNP